ncbi:MAG TPA: ABC transporter permease, partial [Chitinophagaceae bacterium]
MIKSYLQSAYRNLLKHKGATLIKLAGLGIGMACCMLILVYLVDELSYNKFNVHYRDIYRVNFNKAGEGQENINATTPFPVGPAIAQNIPQAAAVARLYNRSGIMEAAGNGQEQKFQEQGVWFSDSSLLDIFSLQFAEGGPGALAAPNSVVITTEMAKKYFGAISARGKSLLYENKTLLQVTAVVEKLPAASDLQFDFLISFPTVYSVENKANGDFMRSNWLYNPAETYVLLQPGQQAEALQPALRQLTKKYGDERVAKSYFLSLQPLSEIHLHAAAVQGNPSTNSITYIYIFAAIALLILLIANINFINLSNAQSLTRISEIGIRKVSGAGSRQLLMQFLGEGLLLSFAAFLLALLITLPGLSLLNNITGKTLNTAALYNAKTLVVFTGLFLCTGLLGGLYPAVFITRFRLTALLKGKTGYRAGGRPVRQLLVITQFAVALALIIGAVVINRQLQFLRNKPLGFQKDQLLVIPLFGKSPSLLGSGVDGPLRARMNAFEDELRRYSRVDAVTLASVLPGSSYVRGLVIPEGHKEQDN